MKKQSFYLGYALAFLLGITSVTLNATTVYVTPWGSGDGSSWSNPLGSVQEAIMVASNSGNGSVWIAQGTYYPTESFTGNLGSDTLRSQVFRLYPGVSIYGGFYGNETALSERALADIDLDGEIEPWEFKNPTILSAERGSISDSSDNYYHVFYGMGLQDSVTFDGLIIEGGYADDYEGDNNFGGGMAIFNGTQQFVINIRYCQLLNNYAIDGGAGCWYSYSQSHLYINLEGSRFAFNSSGNGGAGAAYVWSSSRTDLAIDDCEFEGNSSDHYGGAILGYTVTSSDTVTVMANGSLFLSNKADYGGAVSLYNSGGMAFCQVENSKLFANSALKEGGAVGAFQNGSGRSRTVLFNNVIANGEAALKGGAFYSGVLSGSGVSENFVLQNSIINNKSEAGGGTYLYDFTSLQQNKTYLANNIIWGNDSNQVAYSGGIQRFVENAIQKEDTIYYHNVMVDSVKESMTKQTLWFVAPTDYLGMPKNSTEVNELLSADWHMNSFSVAIDSAYLLYLRPAHDEPLFKDQYFISKGLDSIIYNLADSTDTEISSNLVLINDKDIDNIERIGDDESKIDIGAYETPLAKAVTDTINGVTEVSFIYEGRLDRLNSEKVYTGCVFSTKSGFNPYLHQGEVTIESAFPGKFNTIISNLNPGTTYYLRSKAYNDYADYFDREWSVTTKCEAPKLKMPVIVSDSSFLVSWEPSAGATNYAVKVAKDATFLNCISGYCDSLVTEPAIAVKLPVAATKDDQFYVKVAAVNSANVVGIYATPEIADYQFLSVNTHDILKTQFIPIDNTGVFEVAGKAIYNIVVHDMQGKTVWQQKGQVVKIDLSDLYSGVYVVLFESNNEKLSQKVVLR